MQAFRDLTRWLLAKDASDLSHWASAIATALEPNAAIVVELVPELSLVIGVPQAVPSLPTEAARNRVYATLTRFLRVFCDRQQPLALFLDDLQWLDDATTELLEHLLAEPELENLLLLGAERSREGPRKLEGTLDRLRAGGRGVTLLSLSPLGLEGITRVVADSITSEPELTSSLSRVVEQKTGGNPLFVRQFLATLVDEGLLHFDPRTRLWSWDLPGILAKGHTENLAELVLARLARLPEATRHALQTLACAAGETPAALLASIAALPVSRLRQDMQAAVDAQVVTVRSNHYAFRHDRLQEAAYSSMPAGERAARHLAIGRALLVRSDTAPQGDAIFEVVRHLNRGATLLVDHTERTRVAELNLTAARRSMANGADANALSQLALATTLLPQDHWFRLPELSFELSLARAECEFVCGDRSQAKRLLDDLSSRTDDPVKLSPVVSAQLSLYLTEQQLARALEVGMAYLRRFAVAWPEQGPQAVRRQFELLQTHRGAREVAALRELPLLESASVRAVLDVCATLVSPAYFLDKQLFCLLVLYMATVSLEHGNSDSASLAYVLLCLVLGPVFGEHELGLQFGTLASDLVQGGLDRFAARVYLPMGTIVAPRTRGPHAGLAWIEAAFEAAKRSGDLVYAVYTRAFAVSSLLSAGAPLLDVQRAAEAGVSYARHSRFPTAVAWIGVQLALVRGLRGDGVALGSLSTNELDEDEYERGLSDSPDRFYFWLRRLQARYHAGDFPGARRAGGRARELSWTSPMFTEEVDLWLYGALAEAASPQADVALIQEYAENLRTWSERCPETFASKAALVRAERARLLGKELDAEQEYERAGQLAREHRLVQEEALAHELSARFYARRGVTSVAQAKWQSARLCYAQWGALGKLKQLESEAGVLEGTAGSLLPYPPESSLEQLELGVVISALSAVSSSLELNELIDGLMKGALQQAAADRALLILVGSEPRLRAEAESHQGAIRVSHCDVPIAAADLAEPVLRFVLRSAERVLLADGQVPHAFADGDYFSRRPVRSLLCLPIVLRSKVVGALYLENSLTSQAFGPPGLAVLELIAAQTATALENARLYAEARDAKLRMTRAERISRTGSFSWRPSTQSLDWSEEMLRIYDVSATPSLALVRQRTHADDRALFDRMVADPDRFAGELVELRLCLPDGSTKHVAVTASRIAGEPAEYVGTVCDVTEAKRTDEALQRTQSVLADMTRVASLGEMAAAIAHEVNQPLSAIGLNASTCLRWLDEGQLNPAEAREAALRIRRDASRAGAVIQRLRALFSKTADARAAFDLNEAVTEVMALVRGKVRASGAKLKLELGDELEHAWGDRVQIQQVVMNLVSNALEAMTDQDGERELFVRTHGGAGRLRCEIRDSGKGVPPSERQRIFEPFFTSKADGMGIGLSICSNILVAHGGRVGVTANEGAAGASFYFELPTAPAESARQLGEG